MTSKGDNFKKCGLVNPPVKIQNWKKQCFSCKHCTLIAVRTENQSGLFIYDESVYLLKCPYIIWQRNVCIPTGVEICKMSLMLDLTWHLFVDVPDEVKFKKTLKTEFAEIPRDLWFEILQIPNIQIKPCPQGDCPDKT